MEKYKLTKDENMIIRLSDNVYIPLVEGNCDYQQYLEDVANGATVEPAQTTEEIKISRLVTLDAEYDPQFDALTLAWATASMDGDTATVTARLADKQVLKQEYQKKREAIMNG
jgi:hypothetical protein